MECNAGGVYNGLLHIRQGINDRLRRDSPTPASKAGLYVCVSASVDFCVHTKGQKRLELGNGHDR
jgi:hypothetical protein